MSANDLLRTFASGLQTSAEAESDGMSFVEDRATSRWVRERDGLSAAVTIGRYADTVRFEHPSFEAAVFTCKGISADLPETVDRTTYRCPFALVWLIDTTADALAPHFGEPLSDTLREFFLSYQNGSGVGCFIERQPELAYVIVRIGRGIISTDY